MRRAAAACLFWAAACSRTGLEADPDSRTIPAPPSTGAVRTAEDAAVVTINKDAAVPDDAEARDAALGRVPACEPRAASCNGLDDDCDGKVDEEDEAAPVPCAGGGFRYCVAGRMSECPRRCEACMPGAQRVCFVSYCTAWGVQTCSADGSGFGYCREESVPAACRDVALKTGDGPELEQCCIDGGYCCRDQYDLDGDGNTAEMMGACDEVVCSP